MEVNNYDVGLAWPPRRQGREGDDTISGAFEVGAKRVQGKEQRLCRHPSRAGLTRAAGDRQATREGREAKREGGREGGRQGGRGGGRKGWVGDH